MSKTTVKLILMLLGIAIFLAAYFKVYLSYVALTDELTAQSKTLSAQLSTLKEYHAQLDTYETGIEGSKTEIADKLSGYYSMETPEDFIMLATAAEDDIGVTISGLSFDEAVYVGEIAAIEDITDYTQPIQTRTLSVYGLTAFFEGAMTYSEMKELLAYIYNQDDATSLISLEMSYDGSTGYLLSSMAIDKYYITGRDIEEHQPNVPYTDIGNDSLMGG